VTTETDYRIPFAKRKSGRYLWKNAKRLENMFLYAMEKNGGELEDV
jgi:hypothetical protein